MDIDLDDVEHTDKTNVQKEKRIRKSVSRLSEVYDKSFELQSESKMKPVVGNGIKLGDIIRIQNASHRSKITGELAQNIHMLCYRTKGKANKRLLSIKKFNGFDSNDDSEFKKRLSLTEKMKVDDLKLICDLFNVHSTGKQKKDIANSIVEYLKCPFETGSEIFRMNALKQKSKGKSQPKSSNNKQQSIKSNTSDLNDVDLSSIDNDKNELTNSASNTEETDKNHSENSNLVNKENLIKKKPAMKVKKDKKENKKLPKDKQKTVNIEQPLQESSQQLNANNVCSENELNSSGDNLSDSCFKEKISEILNGADLNKITLNQVCDRVTEQFPDRDLIHKRQHIKSLVKQVIDQAS